MPKIYIDPGHGGSDPGAVAGNLLEKDDNLRYALELQRLFVAQGCEVVMVRTSDIGAPLSARTALANSIKADVYLSCHRNGGGGTGIELWLHSQAPARYITWAQDIIKGCKAYPMPIRNSMTGMRVSEGVFRGHPDGPVYNFAVNRDTTMPSMLVELGFMGNDDAAFDKHYKDYARVIAQATCKFLGVSYQEPQAAPPAEAGPDQAELDHMATLLAEARRERDTERAARVAAETKLASVRAWYSNIPPDVFVIT